MTTTREMLPVFCKERPNLMEKGQHKAIKFCQFNKMLLLSEQDIVVQNGQMQEYH